MPIYWVTDELKLALLHDCFRQYGLIRDNLVNLRGLTSNQY